MCARRRGAGPGGRSPGLHSLIATAAVAALCLLTPSVGRSEPADDARLLSDARDALAEGDATRALELARVRLAAAAGDSDAHVVAGLALFALEAPRAALEHFDRALLLGADDERRVIRFNRAACLYASGKLAQAEAAFVEAAQGDDPELAALSLVNAGFAALERDDRASARRHLAASAERDRRGILSERRAELSRAIAQPSSDQGRSAAPAASTDPAPRAPERPLMALGLMAGYDNNPSQTGYGELVAGDNGSRSPVVGLEADAVWTLDLGHAWLVQPSYTLAQRVFTSPQGADWSSQDHAVEIVLERPLTDLLRAEFGGYVGMGFTGLSDFRPRSADTGASTGLSYRLDANWQLATGLQVEYARALRDEFGFLTGVSFAAEVEQLFEHPQLQLAATVFIRRQGLGIQTLGDPQDQTVPSFRVPLAYHAPGVSVWARKPLLDPLALVAWAQLEARYYTDPFALEFPGTEAFLPVMHQRDTRMRASLSLTYRLAERMSLEAGYQLHLCDSNVDARSSDLHYGNENFTRHLGWAKLTAAY